MLGSWTAVDPATGIREVLTVTPEAITFGAAAPPIPYRVAPAGEWSDGQGPAAEAEDGDALSLYLADGEQPARRSEEHTSELQSLMRISYAVFCLKKKN